jgi:putative component of toxin-antitoxin plasmid stabilization module
MLAHMDVTLHFPNELKRLVKNAAKADKVAIATALQRIENSGIDEVETKPIKKQRGLREILIDAENRYRIMYTRDGDQIHCWSYCKKTSPGEQDQAIDRAIGRLG